MHVASSNSVNPSVVSSSGSESIIFQPLHSPDNARTLIIAYILRSIIRASRVKELLHDSPRGFLGYLNETLVVVKHYTDM
jgi:hypothetical protein